jgi:hypothetical protein
VCVCVYVRVVDIDGGLRCCQLGRGVGVAMQEAPWRGGGVQAGQGRLQRRSTLTTLPLVTSSASFGMTTLLASRYMSLRCGPLSSLPVGSTCQVTTSLAALLPLAPCLTSYLSSPPYQARMSEAV